MTEFFWNQVVGWASVFATTGVSIMAIWGDQVRHWITPPRLKVRLRRTRTRVELIGGRTATRYLHLEVSNGRRWNHINGVIVRITKIERICGEISSIYDTGPLPLKYQFSKEIEGSPPPVIGPPRFCDLGHLTQGKNFRLDTEFVPASCDTELRANEKMRLTIVAIGDTAESRPLQLELSWDGTWHDDDDLMEKSLLVKEVPS